MKTMTPEMSKKYDIYKTERMISVMQAYVDGKEIQQGRIDMPGWEDIPYERPQWNWHLYEYRIKPDQQEPKYRPYKSAEEVLEDMKVHGPMVQLQHTNIYYAITSINGSSVWMESMPELQHDKMLDLFIWQDGTPFGRKEV